MTRGTKRPVRWGWLATALGSLVIGFVTFSNASTVSCPDGVDECWPTAQDHLGSGIIAAATIAAVAWCVWRALRPESD